MKADSALFNLLAPDVIVDIPKVVETLKPGAHLLALSPIATHHSNTIGIEDAGLEIRDTLAWVFSDESNDTAMQLIAMARKPLQGTVAENVLRWGVGGLNIDLCRINSPVGAKHTTSAKGAVGSGGVYEGGYKGEWSCSNPSSESVRHNSLGRWPANLTHNNSPAVQSLFPDTGVSRGGNSTLINVNSGCYNWNIGDKNSPDGVDPGYGDSGSAARFFYSAPCLNDLYSYLVRLITPPNGYILTDCEAEGLPSGYNYVRNYVDKC